MPRLNPFAPAALAAVAALGAASLCRAQPNDVVFVDPATAQALAGPGPVGAPPSADDLRNLAASRTPLASGQFAGAVSLAPTTPAIPHGQIPGVVPGSVLGSSGSVVSASGLAPSGAGASFGLGVAAGLPGGVALGGAGSGVAIPPPPPPG